MEDKTLNNMINKIRRGEMSNTKAMSIIQAKLIQAKVEELRVPYNNGMFNQMGDAYYGKRITELLELDKE